MENKQLLIFKGYRYFNGKTDPSKTYFVLNFMTLPVVTENRGYCQDIDIFVTKEVYNNFIKNNNLLDNIEVSYEIVGNRVQYTLN